MCAFHHNHVSAAVKSLFIILACSLPSWLFAKSVSTYPKLCLAPGLAHDFGLTNPAQGEFTVSPFIHVAKLLGRRPVIFAGVVSAAANVRRRQAIRATWGSDWRIKMMFFVNRPQSVEQLDAVRMEAGRCGDLVLLSHVMEGYYNLTYQTHEIYMAAYMTGGRFPYVLKADDDTYIRVDRLMDAIQGMPRQTWAFLGHMNYGNKPIRDPTSPWYVSMDEWPTSKPYPPWASGAGYVMTSDLARKIAAGGAIRSMPQGFFKLEDVAVGIWVDFVAKEQGVPVQYVNHDGFNALGGCKETDVLFHYVKENQQICTFRNQGACCTDPNPPDAFAPQPSRLRRGQLRAAFKLGVH